MIKKIKCIGVKERVPVCTDGNNHNLLLQEGQMSNLVFGDCGFTYCNFSYADFKETHFTNATFENCNFTGVDFSYVRLSNVDFVRCKLNPLDLLFKAFWGEVSDKLTKELMKFDAACHHKPTDFNKWKRNGGCPYNSAYYPRAINFYEKTRLWTPSLLKEKVNTPYQLICMLFKEKGIIFTWDNGDN